jgi:SpoVK/Ycf46/Vps4 family AAA+-type ATPase
LTNRPDRLDEALKRPGRFDLVLPMPEPTIDNAEDVMMVYARHLDLPWCIDGEISTGVSEDVIRQRFVRPALARFYQAVVLRYKTEHQQGIDVTAAQILSNAHLKDVVNRTKRCAAVRELHNSGVAAVTQEDLLDCLLDVCTEAAKQMKADPQMLIRQLDIKIAVTDVQLIPREQLEEHRYLRLTG